MMTSLEQQTLSPARFAWLQYFLRYDPRPDLATVSVPVLALFGKKDLQVPPREHLPEMVKALQRLGIVGKSASASKAGKEVQEIAALEDRPRAHYLLTRYGMRDKDEDDPLDPDAAKRSAKKPKAAKPVAAKQ